MRQRAAWTRGRIASLLLAGGLGYLVGGWHPANVRNTDLSPAQTVALRFPEDKAGDTGASDVAGSGPAIARAAMVLGNPQLAMLSPEPMVPQPPPQGPVQTAGETAPAENTGAPTAAVAGPATVTAVAARPNAAGRGAAPTAATAASARHRENRPGFVLNDAQIASIKQRLHLTPDQEAMWPAVEAALRNVVYARTREAHGRGTRANEAQTAFTEGESVEVRGLKSAAIPLIMSFSPEQRDEVRGLAHVMGLDNLASQL